jgi:hypothetical protein
MVVSTGAKVCLESIIASKSFQTEAGIAGSIVFKSVCWGEPHLGGPSGRLLEDRAFKNAPDGMAKLVLHNGKPVLVEGKKLYEVTYDNRLLMKLLAGRNPEKYGEYKVVEVNWKDWDGDVSKLSPAAVRGLLDVLRKEAARQEKARAEAEGRVVEVQAIESGSDDDVSDSEG